MSLLHQQNMRLVIFDFDGTIADTSEGIIDSHKFALNQFDRIVPKDEELKSVIGGNLLKTYKDTFGFDEITAREAVYVYRKRYAEVGIHKASLYPGFKELLLKLKKNRFMVGVATLKAETFAKIMLKEMGIDLYFNEVCGMDTNDQLDKTGLIKKCTSLCKCEPRETVLIGDTNNDMYGAEEAGVAFIGVSYGFGFSRNNTYDGFPMASSPLEILNILLN